MSRIGNTPVEVLDGTTVDIQPNAVVVKGTKGELVIAVPSGIAVAIDGNTLTATRRRNDTKVKAQHGTTIALIKNAIVGVTKGWTRQLELHGVGYRAEMRGADIVLHVGFSHSVTINPPQGVTFAVGDGKIMVSGIDRQAVGQAAATIRAVRPPEPYKGKGIRYTGEYVRKKAGKSAKGVGGAPGAA